MRHLELDLTLSFERRQVTGTVVHHLAGLTATPRTVELDTSELTIERVRAGTVDGLVDVPFRLGDRHPFQGRKLHISVPGGADRVEVGYQTAPSASGLQWLSPAQTAGKRSPFLYSQGQTIHARSFIPCIDAPHVRVTFDAVLRVEGGLRAVMAAEDHSRSDEPGVFRFHMPQPVPSYLIAFAAGELEHRDLGPRSGVWAEPVTLDRAAWEFADTERMIEAAERLYGPYRWGRYDLLVMPPAFPLGGMENPRLTFATPTVLAGDRSLVALVAHELAHSWSGNLVTNASWEDFWLNEGFTVYFERRILEALYGPHLAEIEAALGRQGLEAEIADLGPTGRDTWLVLEVGDRNPDHILNEVPYEKGYLFLRLLEETYGRAEFDTFLRGYFDAHAFQTMTTEAFLAHLERELFAKDLARAANVRVQEWVYGPGIPDNAPRADSLALEALDLAADVWLAGRNPGLADQARGWSAHEWLHFLRHLPRDLTLHRMAALDETFGLTRSGNSEILCEWLQLVISTGYIVSHPPARGRLRAFLLEVGRGKFLKPLYRELAKTEEGRAEARAIYAEARDGYHAMTRNTIDAVLAG